MAQVATSDTTTNPQYFGEVVQAVPLQAPALALLGASGLALPSPQSISNPGLRVSWELEPERGVTNQVGVVEISTATVRNNVFTQEYNVIQDFHEAISMSFASQAAEGEPAGSGANIAAIPNFAGVTPTKYDKQVGSLIRGVAKAIDYQIFRGARAYTAGTDSARVMGGYFDRCGSDNNYKDYTTSDIDKDTFIQHLADAYDVGALRGSGEYYCFCSSGVKRKISSLFGDNTTRVLPSSMVSNVQVNQLDTDFGRINLVLAPNTYSYSYCIVDMADQALLGNQVPGKGNFFMEKVGTTKVAEDVWRLWGNLTLKFGHALHIVVGKNIGGTSA